MDWCCFQSCVEQFVIGALSTAAGVLIAGAVFVLVMTLCDKLFS